jgi:chaperone protein EcpD
MVSVMSDLRAPSAFLAALVASGTFIAAPDATAAIVIDTTRVVYPVARREVTITIRNDSPTPSLVQSWLDGGDANSKPGEAAVPFVLTPPLFRLDPSKSQSLRLVYTQEPLPKDRESVFWLNILDVPPRAAANPERPNQLEMAFKHRMKVFFRPAGLKGSPVDAPAQFTWKQIAKEGKVVAIQASNPTPYHVSLVRLAATVNGAPVTAKADMVAPFTNLQLPVETPFPAAGTPVTLEYTFVNDYGGNVKATAIAAMP